jgi:UDP-glucose 4-epimerase
MRIVVTGGSGNIGTALLRALAGRGHDVQAVARRPPGPAAAPSEVSWTALDLADERCEPALGELVRSTDAVVNLAWAFQPMRRPAYLRRSTVGILERVARATLSESATHLVHVSSVAAYSPRRSERRVDEDWPREGIPGATYSRLKVEAERSLEALTTAAAAEGRVTVVRPCLVGQYAAGGPMLRCGAPGPFPGTLVGRLPFAPVDARFGLQLVHADDVADALTRVVEQRVMGSFDLAAEPLLRGPDFAEALRARPVPLPQRAARRAMAALWHVHLSPLDPGWVDMAQQAPWVAASRARETLGWQPTRSARDVLDELLRGMADGAGLGEGALRPRTVGDGIRRAAYHGTVARRGLT